MSGVVELGKSFLLNRIYIKQKFMFGMCLIPSGSVLIGKA